jgi:hypothetical protein
MASGDESERAVPPPDDPLHRHAEDDDVLDREAARRRLEAILQTRRMPEENADAESEND